jgi:hypothetical protein
MLSCRKTCHTAFTSTRSNVRRFRIFGATSFFGTGTSGWLFSQGYLLKYCRLRIGTGKECFNEPQQRTKFKSNIKSISAKFAEQPYKLDAARI